MSKNFLNKEALHHAYFLESKSESIAGHILDFFDEEFSVSTNNNPDIFHQVFETFTIDDGKHLRRRAETRPVGGKKIFIIETRFFTTEAQNVLLKLFEEPGENMHFFIISPSSSILLETLRSRLLVVSLKEKEVASLIDISIFISLSPAERLKFFLPIIKNKDKLFALDFLKSLKEELYQRMRNKQDHFAPKHYQAENFREISNYERYLHGRSPSLKLILDRVSLMRF